MRHTVTLCCLVAFWLLGSTLIPAQTVSTFIGPNINIDDALIMDSEGNLYGSRYTGTAVYKVTPGGQVWSYVGGINAPNGLAFDSQGSLFIAANLGNRIYKVNPADSSKTQFGATILSPSGILRDPLSDTLYVTQYSQNAVVKIAPDASVTPFLANNGLNGPVGSAFDGDRNLYIANYNDGKVFRVTASGGLEQIAVVPGSGFGFVGFLTYAAGNLYATSIGTHRVYRITLAGDMTVLAGSGSPGLQDGPAASARFSNPNGIFPSPTGDKLYISDFATRSIRVISGIVTGIESRTDGELPQQILLQANYPNPFNPATTISFEMPVAAPVDLQIYDISGRQVASLFSGQLPAGFHRIRFDAGDLASGVYLYRLTANGQAFTRKMMLVK